MNWPLVWGRLAECRDGGDNIEGGFKSDKLTPTPHRYLHTRSDAGTQAIRADNGVHALKMVARVTPPDGDDSIAELSNKV